MKVLVLGGTRFFGVPMVNELLRHGHQQKTGAKAVIGPAGEPAPYNGEPSYSINTDRAKALGFRFSSLRDWIYGLLDHYIELSR